MSLFYKILLGFLIIILLFGSIGFVTLSLNKKDLRQLVLADTETLVRESLDKMDMAVYNRIELFRDYAEDELLRQTLLRSNREFEGRENVRKYLKEKDSEWLSTPAGELSPLMQRILKNNLSVELIRKLEFYSRKRDYDVFGEIFVTNKFGANVGMTGRTSDYRQDDEEWWKMTRRYGFHVEDIDYDKSSGIYSLDIGSRIDDEGGNFIGVIKAVLNIKDVLTIIESLHGGHIHSEHRSMKYYLITKDGRLIYSNDDSIEFLEDVLHLFPDEKDILTEASHSHNVSRYETQSGDRDAHEEIITYARSDGQKEFKGLGWVLMMQHSAHEIFAPLGSLRDRILIVSLVFGVIGIIISYVIASTVARNIRKLNDAAIRIGRGEMDSLVEVQSKDEIGKLAETFNYMMKELRVTTVSRDKLIVEVDKRTKAEKELKENVDELEKFYDMAIGREVKMKELKEEIRTLRAEQNGETEEGKG